MSCERYRKTLAGLAAGEPPSVDVDVHLVACAACSAELASLCEGLALAEVTLHDLVSHEPSPMLAERIRRAVAEDREEAPGTSLQPWRWVWAASAAGLLLLVAAAWQWGRLTSAPGGTRPESGAPAPLSAPVRTPFAVGAPSQSAPPEGDYKPVQQASASAESTSGGTRHRSARRLAEPIVLVPPGEAEALLQFAAALQGRTVDPGSLLVADPMSGLPEPKPIRIEPFRVAPLDEGDRS